MCRGVVDDLPGAHDRIIFRGESWGRQKLPSRETSSALAAYSPTAESGTSVYRCSAPHYRERSSVLGRESSVKIQFDPD